MPKHAIIMMTALVPTTGHKFLIDFASNFLLPEDYLHVIISTRRHEPSDWKARVAALMRPNVGFYEHDDDHAPQNPMGPNDTEFWQYWKDQVQTVVKRPIDIVFASEPYGEPLAKVLGAEFIPVDIARATFPVKGSDVRENLFERQFEILEGFRHGLNTNVVLFGPESCGKTTMAKRLAEHFHGRFLPEWARPYLECVGAEVTPERMLNIVNGQLAQERAAMRDQDRPIMTFLDTDLLTTLGFYRLYNIPQPSILAETVRRSIQDKLYVVMNDGIPFTPDVLRYGGDVRETGQQFWIDILEEFDRPYYTVKSTDRDEQFEEIKGMLLANTPLSLPFGRHFIDLINFKRD